MDLLRELINLREVEEKKPDKPAEKLRARPDAVNFKELEGETITNVKYGSPHYPRAGSYGAVTITTKSGKEFVLTQGFGEVNLSKLIPL